MIPHSTEMGLMVNWPKGARRETDAGATQKLYQCSILKLKALLPQRT